MSLRIVGGRVWDPVNGRNGEPTDLCIDGGRIVSELPADAPKLDATGLVVMPGGVDIHSHIAGPKVNLARRLEPQRRRGGETSGRALSGAVSRSGTRGTVPSTFATGELYSLLGYTTVFDAAVPLLGARQAHLELDDTPCIDKGFYLLLGNDEFLLRSARDPGKARDVLAWALGAARAYGVKVVNPGGVEAWKSHRLTPGLDDVLPGRDLTPRQILTAVARGADELRLPHPMHLHCAGLGLPGNAATTLETMGALDGHRTHFAHLQFHCYGEAGGAFTSRAVEVVERLNANPLLSADCGQVMFGPAMAMTADSPVAAMLHDLAGGKWVDADLELEGGCGIVPYEYRATNAVHALQFVTGLELLLLARDPWRLVLSTDHPNGGTFLRYPRLIRLLMDRAFRDEVLSGLPKKVLEGTALGAGLDREYTLSEVAIVTRAGPARLLGLGAKGHLGSGADADIAVYTPGADAETMFAAPRFVFKAGVLVAAEGRLVAVPQGRTLCVAPPHDPQVESFVKDLVATEGTLALEDYVIGGDELRSEVLVGGL
jgi:formylmethanofuran dehydrogenase subunit A